MAFLRFYDAAPPGLRLEAIFTEPDGPITFGSESGLDVARAEVTAGGSTAALFYDGRLDAQAGDVNRLRVESGGVPWILYGDEAAAARQFSYAGGLEAFQRSGAAAVATLLGGDDAIKGSSHGDHLEGLAGNDRIDAGPGDDILDGGAGNDFLDGGAGADGMAGGAGDDTYVVDSPLDAPVEADGFGWDSLFASVDYGLADGVAIEVLGAGGTAAVSLQGNVFPNVITGNASANALAGQGGNDTVYGDGGGDRAAGGDGADGLFGGLGNDTLNGGAGDDRAFGDLGNDALTGGAGRDRLFGGTGADRLAGGAGHDRLYGDIGNDVLSGEGGNDLLYAGLGTNTLRGGAGNDRAYGSEGRDRLFGDAGRDRLFGDAGADTLSVGLGVDMLSGGPGRDRFLFDTLPHASTNADRILDFSVPQDSILLENAIFRQAGPKGGLRADAFRLGAVAQDGDDRVLFDRDTGALYYDADGTGGLKAVLFAKVAKGLDLGAGDFIVV
ncbi:MAG TPA: calcium-binding protein [Microvirga sp.]|nr:calcium-binding protein [Microvirga sp.]